MQIRKCILREEGRARPFERGREKPHFKQILASCLLNVLQWLTLTCSVYRRNINQPDHIL